MHKQVYFKRPPHVKATQITEFDQITDLPGFEKYIVFKDAARKFSRHDPFGLIPTVRAGFREGTSIGYETISVGDYVVWHDSDKFEIVPMEEFEAEYDKRPLRFNTP